MKEYIVRGLLLLVARLEFLGFCPPMFEEGLDDDFTDVSVRAKIIVLLGSERERAHQV